jgi:aspartyl-tRNA(Asn)/glutamyl-tRNA(Gln) amidotransferase subunit A
LGRVREFTEGMADTEAVRSVEAARKHLLALGATTVDVSLPIVAAGIAIYYVVAPAEASSNLARYDGIRYGLRAPATTLRETYARSREEGFGAEVKRRILMGTFALSAGYGDAYYKRAMAARAALRASLAEVFQRCDVLISATTPTAAFALGDKVSDPLEMYRCDLFTVAANLAGVPAISIPCGRDASGLPLGLQVWGPIGADERVLRVAAALEHHVAACRYRPPGTAPRVPTRAC